MIFDRLKDTYFYIANMDALSHSPESQATIRKKLEELATVLKSIKSIEQQDQMILIQRISQIKQTNRFTIVETIQHLCAVLELKTLLKNDDLNGLVNWILKNKEGVTSQRPKELFESLSKLRKRLARAQLLQPHVRTALSNIITHGLGLAYQKNTQIAKKTILRILKQNSPEALGHWVSSQEIPLMWIDKSELEGIAPYLNSVYCNSLIMDDLGKFISSCSNAVYLRIKDISIEKLEHLPLELQRIDCINCPNLNVLDLSNLEGLHHLFLHTCPKLTTLDTSHNLYLQSFYCHSLGVTSHNLSKNQSLQVFECRGCPADSFDFSHNLQLRQLNCGAKSIDLSHNVKLEKLNCYDSLISTSDLTHNLNLKEFYCRKCPNLSTLDFSKFKHLEVLDCSENTISTLDLSHNPKLQSVSCSNCPNITTLDLSHNLKLQKVVCNNCENLSSLLVSLLSELARVSCLDCPRLIQLPEVPPRTLVDSNRRPRGILNSFNVNPADLEKNPKQMLLDIGRFLLRGEPFPNIVYMDPATGKPTPGIDTWGLKRQFVATLCENLFKEGSGFSFIKIDGYDIPVCNNASDLEALKAFARILGIAILLPLPTGTNLHPSFFHSLFALSEAELEKIPNDHSIPEPPKKKLHMARQGLPLSFFDEEETEDMRQESNILAGAAIVAKELQKHLGLSFRRFEGDINEFITEVQGLPVTKAALLQSISCNDRQYNQWIENFIDELKPHEIKQFLLLLTGSYTLSGLNIYFEVDPARKYLNAATIIHSCSRTMKLPGDFTEALLHKELKAQLSLLKTFNSA